MWITSVIRFVHTRLSGRAATGVGATAAAPPIHLGAEAGLVAGETRCEVRWVRNAGEACSAFGHAAAATEDGC